MKKYLCLILVVTFAIFAVPQTVSALGKNDGAVSPSGMFDYIDRNTRSEFFDLGDGYSAVIDLQENSSALMRSTTRRTLTSRMQIRNPLGITIATLTAVGVFDTNGSISDPYDAHGSGNIPNVQNPSNTLGAPQFNAYVKVNLTGFLPGGDTTFGSTQSDRIESSMSILMNVSFNDGYPGYSRNAANENRSFCEVLSDYLGGHSGSTLCYYYVNGQLVHTSTAPFPFNF